MQTTLYHFVGIFMAKRIWGLLGWGAALLVLSACGAGRGTASATITPETATPVAAVTREPTPTHTPTPVVVNGTIRIWHSWQEAQVPALLKAIEVFQQRFPNVLFDVLYVPVLDLKASYEQAALEGRSPSILIGPGEWSTSLYDAGLTADLSGLANGEILNILNTAAVDACRYQGALVGLPVNIRGVVIYRNQSIIPRPAATFDELISLAKTATRGTIFGAVLDRSFFFGGGNLFGLGGQFLDADGLPSINNVTGLEWVNLLNSYAQAGPTEFSGDSDLTLFKEGRAGIIIDGTWRMNELADAIGSANLVIDPWPVQGSGSMAGFVQTENIFLSPQAVSEDFLISWQFVQELLGPASQSNIAEAGMIPSLSGSPVNLAAGEVRVKDLHISQAMQALVDGSAYPQGKEIEAIIPVVEAMLRRVYEEQASPAAALQEAELAMLEALNALKATAIPTPTP